MDLTREEEAIIEERFQGMSEDEMHEIYDSFIDQTTEEISILGITFSASEILKKVDPIAYRCYFNDWLDGEEVVEINDYYYNIVEIEDLLEELAEEDEDEEEEELEAEETPT